MNPDERKQIESMAWYLCLLLSDNNLDRAKRKYNEMVKE